MKMPWRRPSVPTGVRSVLGLRTGERVLATARSGEADFVVATTVSLCLVEARNAVGATDYSMAWRVRWDQIDKARWDPPLMNIELRSVLDEVGTDTVQVHVDQVSQLPAVVRDRVNDSILASEEIAVSDGSVRVIARRNSDTGEAVWRVVFGPGVDSQDPEVRREAEEGLAALRSRLGV
jgi:hypothetical protein